MYNAGTSFYLENELANHRSIFKSRSLPRFSNLFAPKFHLFPYDGSTSQITKTAISPLSIYIAPRFYLKYILWSQIDPIRSVHITLIRSKFDKRIESRGTIFTRVELRDTHGKKGENEYANEYARSSFHLPELPIFDRCTTCREKKNETAQVNLFSIYPPYIHCALVSIG